MLLCFKNYGFTAQNLWSCSSKSMFLQPESIGFVCKHLIGLFEKNQKSLYSFVNQEIVKGASKLVCFATKSTVGEQYRAYESLKFGFSMTIYAGIMQIFGLVVLLFRYFVYICSQVKTPILNNYEKESFDYLCALSLCRLSGSL